MTCFSHPFSPTPPKRKVCGGLVVWFGDFVGGVEWICDIVWLVVCVWVKDGANKYQFEGMKRRNKFSGEVINLQKMILIIYNMAHGAMKIQFFIYILPGNIFQRLHVFHCFQCKNYCYKNLVLGLGSTKQYLEVPPTFGKLQKIAPKIW